MNDLQPPQQQHPSLSVADRVPVQPVTLQAIPEAPQQSASLFQDLAVIQDVRIKLRAVLGEAEISLEELFALREGSALTLDCAANADLDLLLNDKPVARGSLVVVGEHFGVQINQILRDHADS